MIEQFDMNKFLFEDEYHNKVILKGNKVFLDKSQNKKTKFYSSKPTYIGEVEYVDDYMVFRKKNQKEANKFRIKGNSWCTYEHVFNVLPNYCRIVIETELKVYWIWKKEALEHCELYYTPYQIENQVIVPEKYWNVM